MITPSVNPEKNRDLQVLKKTELPVELYGWTTMNKNRMLNRDS